MEKSYSKAWDWSLAKKPEWLSPAPEAYYLAARWKGGGKRDFLDFGTGIGRHSLFFAEQGFAVKGFDLSQEGVETTKKRLVEHGFYGDFHVADMLHIPFPDESVDCLLAYHVITHTDTEGIEKAIGEIYRLLRKGGEAYFDVCAKWEGWYPLEPSDPHYVDPNTRILADSGPEKGIPHFFASKEQILRLLKDFEIISLKETKELISGGKETKRHHFWALIRKP